DAGSIPAARSRFLSEAQDSRKKTEGRFFVVTGKVHIKIVFQSGTKVKLTSGDTGVVLTLFVVQAYGYYMRLG
ncbi:hypothetical protein DRK15_12825, partial [Salmonella enterica subsp. enterica]|nr:hypothetical protein [Salmonella enterica subsp. enterica serovar Muenster]